ncbi:hypothetical protein KSP40_PGU014653 [Platanthera guangdongensis]|uniref:DUF7356 domain-containing protein n=1 Tax=Platanthera guangdongensis TaxID=2320717 RepID=A0ABR2N557_9ASPA
MKGRVAFLLKVLLHILLICLLAADGNSEGTSTPNTGSQAVNLSDIQKAPSHHVREDGERKDVDQIGRSQQETTTNALKGKGKNVSEGKNKPLKEPKASGDISKESVVEGSNKKKPLTIDPQKAGCDPSNRCINKKNNLVVCLRVPGTDTQALSLVIQNKGKGSLDIKIIAPPYVHLEQSAMQIKAKEDKEVKVYVNEDRSEDSMIILQAPDGNCSLDLRNVMQNSISKTETLTMSGFISPSIGYALVFIFFAAVVVVGVIWLCVRFRPLLRRETGLKYPKLDVGLPVSTGENIEAVGGTDGWDNSWENGWDEEEVPLTPSETISKPSLKGLASRKFNKDGWKD